MIQILGLREFTTKQGEVKLRDAFFDNQWRVPDIFDLFLNMEKHLEMIPEDVRWNLFYTVANCTDEKRKFDTQAIIPIDIDGIVKGTEPDIVTAVLEELKLKFEDVGVVYSGNGIHLLIGLKNPIPNASFINSNKVYYKALCGRVNHALYNSGLKGKCDTTVFSEARILRLPFTENRKNGKETTICKLVQRRITALDVDLFSLADLPSVSEGEYVHHSAIHRMPEPDRAAIEKGCGFIKHCFENQHEVSEPEWYAMLSVVGRFPDATNAVHQYSQRYPNYNPNTTESKLQHALEASGPRTCNNIYNTVGFEGCQKCPHYQKITSPIQIVGEETIRTKNSGFYEMVPNGEGGFKKGKPSYDDLEKWFRKKYSYVTVEQGEATYCYNGRFWEELPSIRIKKFAEDHFKPTPSHSMCMEFESKLKRMFITPLSEMNVTDKLNFQNGVLDLETKILEPHSEKFKFTYCIPYDYNPKGDCPIFKQFLQEISCDDQEMVEMLAEYVGYCISGTDPALVQKCALLYGDGANGKSVLLSLMREMVGQQNCSAMSIDSIKKETHRYQLMNKLFNACAESPSNAFLESEAFKSMVSGDDIEVRKLYSEPAMWKCTTKLIFACNELPFNGDFSHGLYRRLIILPFRNTFSDEKGNKDPMILQKLLTERSDIFKFCLEAFDNTKARGYKFKEPQSAREELEDYREMGDIVARFTYGMCFHTDSIVAPILSLDTIYNLFAMWCKDNNQGLISYGSFARRFGKLISKRYPKVERIRPREDIGKRGTSYRYLGISAVNSANI